MAEKFAITPIPKTKENSLQDYITYFERVMDANGWDDATSAKIFQSLLEVGNRHLDSVSGDELLKFSTIKEALIGNAEPYREANLDSLLSCRKKPNEEIPDFRDRVSKLVDSVYPKFTKDNRLQLCRDFFINGLPMHIKQAVRSNAVEKLDEAVNAALLADSLAKKMNRPPPNSQKYSKPGHTAPNSRFQQEVTKTKEVTVVQETSSSKTKKQSKPKKKNPAGASEAQTK